MGCPPTNILDPIRANVEKHPDRTAFAFLDGHGKAKQSYSYEAFLRRTGDIASHIHHTHPLEPGERVVLVYPPGLEVICAFFACVRLGLIPVPVYPPSSHGFVAARHRMDAIAKDCGAAAVLTDRSYYWSMKLHSAKSSIASLSLGRSYTSRLKWMVTGDARPDPGARFPEAHSETLFLQYTSGSTSDPKGVMVSHGNVLANCDAVVDHTPTAVTWLPQYHDMGLIAFYLFSPIKGGTTYGTSPLDFIQRPLLWLEGMSRLGATASSAPNFAYEYCLRPDKISDAELEGLDLSALRVLLNGAEPVKPRVFRDFLARFRPHGLRPRSFSVAYGLAENTLAVTVGGREARSFDADELKRHQARPVPSSTGSEEAKTLMSCGEPVGSTELKIVDVSATPREAPEGRVGEVWVAGPSTCPGYWGRPETSGQVFEARLDGEDRGRWLRTGDLGFVLGGELYICGRAKDMIIVRGSNFYPQDIEAVVEEDPAIRRGCVAAFATEEEGREVVVVAELKKKARLPDAHVLNAAVRQRLGITVDLFVFIPRRTIPKTSSGKISRHRALAGWLEGGLEVVDQVETTHQPAGRGRGDSVAAGAGGASGRPDLRALFRRHGLTGEEDTTLVETELDSMAMADFAADLKQHLEALDAPELAAGLQVRWLQKIRLSELFELIRHVGEAAPHAGLRLRKAFAELRREELAVEEEMMRHDRALPVAVGGGSEDSPEGSQAPWSPEAPRGAGAAILLTGGTGFFGPFLLRSLLEQQDDPIYVLTRAADPEQAMERLEEGLRALEDPVTGSAPEGWKSRVIPVCGDLSRPALGLAPDRWRELAEGVHTVYHNGAAVNYLLDYQSMREANVEGTREIIRLAGTGRPTVLNHVSTTFVFGWSTKDVLLESDANRDMELLDFGYSQSKWVSEQLVLRAMDEGLPARIFRPALIAPSVDGGGYNFDIAIRLLAFMLDHGITTTAGNQVSLNPADVAAGNIVAISGLRDTVGQTFHVTRDEHATLLDVSRVLGRLTDANFAELPIHEFVPTMIERCRRGDLLFPLVNFLVHSVDNITAMQFKRYDSSNYQAARARSPFGVPDPPLEDVVAGIVRFMIRHGIVAEDRLLAEYRGVEAAGRPSP